MFTAREKLPTFEKEYALLHQTFLEMKSSKPLVIRFLHTPEKLEDFYDLTFSLFLPPEFKNKNKFSNFILISLECGISQKERLLFQLNYAKKFLEQFNYIHTTKFHIKHIDRMMKLANQGYDWLAAFIRSYPRMTSHPNLLESDTLRRKIILDLPTPPFCDFQRTLAIKDPAVQLGVNQLAALQLKLNYTTISSSLFTELKGQESVLKNKLCDTYQRKVAEVSANPDLAIQQLKMFSSRYRKPLSTTPSVNRDITATSQTNRR